MSDDEIRAQVTAAMMRKVLAEAEEAELKAEKARVELRTAQAVEAYVERERALTALPKLSS